jgi:hypothetical protein
MKIHAVAAEPGDDLAPDEVVTLEQARDLAAALGGGVDVGELRAALNDSATFYRHLLWAEDATRPKCIRIELDQLIEAFDAALAKLDQLDDRAMGRLNAALRDMVGQKGSLTRGVAFTRSNMERIQGAAKCARANLPSGDGRPGLNPLRHLCGDLAAIYEGFGGRRFTYDAHRASGGPPAFVSAGARWIADAVSIIDPEVTPSNLGTVLPNLRKPLSKTA